ncbi:BTB/POZ-like [Penicillium digitatum]|uniref:BTB domain-containing protein n=3 Tax=Penicillium digitatum TaxID=36651 RepID=K9GI29_PEND2|nr:hypothetical protein PDIP_86180 [Penicillium digitatum Pd1]EKV04777.1 hypothetical protein PDIP_86180 [Penicillium digitatum Pd1]EKV12856.1 hypothetical protein PDIG_41260 [Penicillium digitatum PHI26]KAG0159975.1 hypothetical protein PDIDSM_7502 [Penicillium digitatum]QQK45917.1 BTB/POZ-like [Penicillium digitatum]
MASRTNFHQFPSTFKDCPIQVIVGPQKTVYYVHPGVLSSCGSPVLKARVNDQWIKNGTSGAIDWTEFDEETVECALSYLYIEDYDVRDRTFVGAQIEERNDNDQIAQAAFLSTKAGSSVPDSKILNEALSERPLTPLSRCLQVGLPAETMQTAAAAFMKEPSACDEGLGDIALMHGKLYCFAHQFLFSRLENLALQRLTQLLLKCDTPTDPFFLGLADAIRLVYGATPKSKPNDPARELLSQYVALKYTILPESSMRALIAEGGDFMIDVTCKLARRISISGTSTQSLEGLIDELEMSVSRLEQHTENQACLLKRAEEEILEWESWNRGISAKHKKAKRMVAPFEFSTTLEHSA